MLHKLQYCCDYDIIVLTLFPALLVGADVSKRKDGGIRKSTLVKGKGREVPNDGATCEGNINLADVSQLDVYCVCTPCIMQILFNQLHFSLS